MRENHGLKILQKIENFLMELQTILKGYPKVEKYTLAERTESEFLDATKQIYGATYSPEDRLDCLKYARIHFQLVGMFLRIARRKAFLSEGAYENLSRSLDEIGKMTSGWIKTSQDKTNKAKNAENL